MNRRDFLAAGLATGAGLASAKWSWAEVAASRPHSNAASLPQRPYREDVKLSVIGFPGFALRGMEPDRVARLVGESFERGVNYFDVAPSYGDAEQRLGPALEPYRKNVFLACKTGQRDAAGAAAELKRSFEHLRTDHFDLYQLHHINDVEKDVEAAFRKGGVMEVAIQAKKDGRVRFLGFSAHSEEAALRAMELYDFDSALFPLNFAAMHKGKWGGRILEKARQKGVACLALKAMARQQWPKNDPKRNSYPICWYQPLTDVEEAELGLRYTLSQNVVAAIPPSSDRLARLAILLAADYRPITPQEDETLKKLAESLNPVFTNAKT